MAAQSDPDKNPNFPRRWAAPPLKRTSPRPSGIGTGAQYENGTHLSERDNSLSFRLLQLAVRLDRRADAELAVGRHDLAEHLSRLAAELREAGR